MSKLVNLSDGVYAELTRLKKAKGESYSEVIEDLLEKGSSVKTHEWSDVIARIRERDKKFKGKTKRIDHDLIAHGVSRDGS